MKQLLTVTEEGKDSRLDAYISGQLDGLSRSYIQKILKNGGVLVNGKAEKSSYRVLPGDVVEVTAPEPTEPEIVAEKMDLDILYEDQDIILINKPKGMVVHPAAGHYSGTLVNGLMDHCRGDLSGINGVMRPGIVHRIDMDTTGVLIVCKNDFAHQSIAEQLKVHSITRKYYAIVHGVIKEDQGTVNAPIGRHPTDRKKMCVTQRNSKNAVTHWEVVKRYRGYTHVRCRLETGRTHQIRVHMAYIGHPILGDMVYGHKKPELGQSSQCLHAGILSFSHPRDGRPVVVVAPLPDYFLQVLDKLERIS